MASSIYKNENKLISSLNARIFSIKSNIAFGKQFLELNPDDSPVRTEIVALVQQQVNYEIEIAKIRDSLSNILDSIKNENNQKMLNNLKLQSENQAKLLLNDAKVNSVLKKLKQLRDEGVFEVKNDFDIKMDQVYEESSNLSDKAFKNGLIIVFIGRRGTGKSSFINYLCGVENFANNSVATNVVEQTLEPQFITFDSVENVKDYKNTLRMWDFPGIGTEDFPIDEYKMMVQHLPVDAYIYTYKTRFNEIDCELIKYLMEKKEKVFILRNFADQDLQTILEQNNKESIDDIDDETLKQYINEFWPIVTKQHEEESKKMNTYFGCKNQIFYVSCILRKHFDNEKFLQELIGSLPKAKAAIMLFVIQLKSLALFKKKCEIIKQSILPMWAFESTLVFSKSGPYYLQLYVIEKTRQIFKFYGLQMPSELNEVFGINLTGAQAGQSSNDTLKEALLKTSLNIAATNPKNLNHVKMNSRIGIVTLTQLQHINEMCFAKAVVEVVSID